MTTWYPLPSSGPLTCYTGMCTVAAIDPAAERRRQEDEARRLEDARVVSYFEGLGYSVGQDWSHRHGSWHEISDDEGLVVQIDMGVSLADIVETFTLEAEGKTKRARAVGERDWSFCTEESARFKRLAKQVKANQFGGIQTDLSL